MDSGITQSADGEPTIPKVLLIDLENCPNQLHNLPSDLANYAQVVICYAQSASKIPLNWLNPLSTAISAGRLKVQKMERVGKNSADFGICFLAGALMQQLPKETHFVIVSNDTDLDHVVHLLKTHGRSSERIGASHKEKEPADSVPSSQASASALYCVHLINHAKNRPAKTSTLLNSIKNKYPSSVDFIYKELIAKGAIRVVNTKVIYDDKNIKKMASS